MKKQPDPPPMASAWKKCPLLERLHDCVLYLRLRGVMTVKERDRIRARLLKWEQRAIREEA